MKPTTRLPVLVCAAIIAGIWLVHSTGRIIPRFDFFTRLEWITYDWRMRLAARSSPPATSTLGFVAISDDSIEAVRDGMYGNLPYHFGLYWPRQVYARLVHELAAQGASAVGFDVLFGELRPDHPPMTLPEGGQCGSDDFFAAEIRKAGNVVLAADKGMPPHSLFRTNALALAHISTQRESDGILRRAKAYEDIYLWHPLIEDAGRLLDWDLRQARVEPGRIIFPIAGRQERVLPLRDANQFDQGALYEELTRRKPPAEVPPLSTAFTRLRCWQMGIALAARELGLDLARARLEPKQGRIVLLGTNGATRIIPTDPEGRFYIDWSMTPYHPALTTESIESLLLQYEQRSAGRTAELTNRWKDKLVVVGSIATGNDLTDLGATPLEKETYLLGQQWNVANSVISGRFVRVCPLLVEWTIILLLGALAGLMTWNLRVLTATASVLATALIYVGLTVGAFIQLRWWMPIVLPVGGALLTMHASLVTYRVLREQKERRRIEDIFGHIVSPSVRDELIGAPHLSLGGVAREITVMFADIRGFTSMTDASQAAAQEYVRRRQLSSEASREYLERRAQEILTTVNLYLGAIADTVKEYDGTLDKYIGDCVMAFWGAPTPSDQHAASCVRAMVEAQRKLRRLNLERTAENERRAALENRDGRRIEEPLPPLPLLSVGIGINTGPATVGLIGSETHILNYTAFGREVNIASRLEEIAGPGCISVTRETYLALQRDAPDLAALCEEHPPATLKGIRLPVRRYEVRWQQTEASPFAQGGGDRQARRAEGGKESAG
jgi:class 3 adenylate cyclase/CHASE2 domain-containing sensor protein